MGGETAALKQLEQFFVNSAANITTKVPATHRQPIKHHVCRHGLQLGCLSLRQIYWEVIKHQHSISTQNANALVLDLLWRDYFRFMFKKHGQKFIAPKDSLEHRSLIELNHTELFEAWKQGETGIPIVDAIIHELNATGYINSYGRQLIAGFLVHELKIDWKLGAAYFEEKLIDYSPPAIGKLGFYCRRK